MVLAVALGSIVLLTGMTLVVIDEVNVNPGDSTNGPGSRPLLVQEIRPGVAYRYGSASIYNACSIVTLDDLRRQGLTPDAEQRLNKYYPVVDQPEKTYEQNPLNLSGPSEYGIFVQEDDHVNVEVL